MPALLEAQSVEKSFGGAQALKGAGLSIEVGEVHGLVGANGAGKSTFIKVLAGLVRPDAGDIRISGVPVSIQSPQQATALGLSFIHQELAFVPGMSVIENIMLGVPKKMRLGAVDWQAIGRDVEPLARRVGLTSPMNADVKRLSTAERWLISICRALVRRARLIVMDEPTASLSAAEGERLFRIIEDLSASGVAVLYVSHRLDEILRLCRRVTAFRDGRCVASLEGEALDRHALVEAIVGHPVAEAQMTAATRQVGPVALSVKGLCRLPQVRSVSFDLHAGEVLGLGGLVGSGRSELARLVFGADRPHRGEMTLFGNPFVPRNPAQAVAAGVGLVPEERRAEGLVLGKSVAFNLALGNLSRLVFSRALPLIRPRATRSFALGIIRRLAVKAESADTPIVRLSGGNQQKVLIGRWLERRPRLLILDEPTRGVDIGARSEIHRLVRELAARGMAVLVISSEPDELPELCDRVLVMAEGRIVAELEGESISRGKIVAASYQEPERAAREEESA
ncbi:MAG TPA: sugar ABC transporter ATP-binding protein [Mesorhizobium sp.]|jgi:ribose transport system ATP-binding protein/rhamnose transport system ATP-binding protein|nr:sugar ABC transporter ATP-binding protein [Mesorhizobium sp.]